MIVQDVAERLEVTSTGFVRLRNAQCTSPVIPNIRAGDIIGEIILKDGIFTTGDRFLVGDEVSERRFRETKEFALGNIEDHLDPVPEVFGYKFAASYIPSHKDLESQDVKYDIPFEDPIWLINPDDLLM